LLASVAREGLAIMTGLFFDLGDDNAREPRTIGAIRRERLQ